MQEGGKVKGARGIRGRLPSIRITLITLWQAVGRESHMRRHVGQKGMGGSQERNAARCGFAFETLTCKLSQGGQVSELTPANWQMMKLP